MAGLWRGRGESLHSRREALPPSWASVPLPRGGAAVRRLDYKAATAAGLTSGRGSLDMCEGLLHAGARPYHTNGSTLRSVLYLLNAQQTPHPSALSALRARLYSTYAMRGDDRCYPLPGIGTRSVRSGLGPVT